MKKETSENKVYQNSLLKIFKLVVSQEKKLWSLYSVLEIFHGLSFVLSVLVTQQLFDSLSKSVDQKNVKNILIAVLILFSCGLFSQLLNGITNYLANYIKNIVIGKIYVITQEKASRIKPIEYERSLYLDDIEKAVEGIKSSCDLAQIILSVFFFYIPYFTFMSIYLFKQSNILIFSVLLVFIPVLLGQFIKSKYSYELNENISNYKRASKEFEKSLVDLKNVKEVRLFGANKFFFDKLKETISLINSGILDNGKKNLRLSIYLNLISIVGYVTLLSMLFILTIRGGISIGAFGAIFSSIEIMFIIMDEIINDSLGQISEKSGLIVHLVNFMSIPEKSTQKGTPLNKNLELKNVSFHYPDTNINTIENINLNITEGEKIAVVGMNGSGKTTLVKLLTAIFEPTEGTIFIHGMETNKTDPNVIHKLYSIVFQKFNRYKLSLEDNVRIANFKDNKKDYKSALSKASFNVNNENNEINGDTILSREFDGIDLSGGQWQRIALSRAYFRNREIIVLDEPTSAIDPIEETQLYHQFFSLTENKTSIIITHRLGSAKLADRVILMDKGRIIGDGTHEDLIMNNLPYKKMWDAQARWYDR